MFKKSRVQLTIFFTFITGMVIIILSFICILISERGMRDNSSTSFYSYSSSVLTYLENQLQISNEWMAKIQNNKRYLLYIEDNGNPLIFPMRSFSEENFDFIDLVKEQSSNDYHLDLSFKSSTSTLSEIQRFTIKDKEGTTYHVMVSLIPKKQGYLALILAQPLDTLQNQMIRQRILFILADAVAIIVLGMFSWLFTKKILRPIQESQVKQAQFIAAASHELRTPLMVILSSVSALRKSNEEERIKFESDIESEGLQMRRLINDMLSLASADSKGWSMTITNVDLDDLLINAYEKYMPIAATHKLTLRITLPDEDFLSCLCDPLRIQQVLGILLDNAISYTPTQGEIFLSLNKHGKDIQICVADTGPGIPDPIKKKVFERFFRGDKNRSKKEHFGMGLSIAYEIIKLHKGNIEIKDRVGGGALFVITLPRRHDIAHL